MTGIDTNVFIYACDRSDLKKQERARHLHLDRHMGFWDAMIVDCCIAEGVGVLYSEDLPAGRVEHLDIVNPFA